MKITLKKEITPDYVQFWVEKNGVMIKGTCSSNLCFAKACYTIAKQNIPLELEKIEIIEEFETSDTITNEVLINNIELASELAHNSTRDEMTAEQYITQEGEMQDNENPENYTDHAQEIFNRWYDYYRNMIDEATIR